MKSCHSMSTSMTLREKPIGCWALFFGVANIFQANSACVCCTHRSLETESNTVRRGGAGNLKKRRKK